MSEPKYMSVKEFRRLGYLQELNRIFLHPLGLALAVSVDGEGNESFSNDVWDARDDPEGYAFDEWDLEKADRIDREMNERWLPRTTRLGFWIQS